MDQPCTRSRVRVTCAQNSSEWCKFLFIRFGYDSHNGFERTRTLAQWMCISVFGFNCSVSHSRDERQKWNECINAHRIISQKKWKEKRKIKKRITWVVSISKGERWLLDFYFSLFFFRLFRWRPGSCTTARSKRQMQCVSCFVVAFNCEDRDLCDEFLVSSIVAWLTYDGDGDILLRTRSETNKK